MRRWIQVKMRKSRILHKIFPDKSECERQRVNFTVSTFKIKERNKCVTVKATQRTVTESNLFAVILKLTNPTHFPATLIKVHEKLYSHFRIKSRENVKAPTARTVTNNGPYVYIRPAKTQLICTQTACRECTSRNGRNVNLWQMIFLQTLESLTLASLQIVRKRNTTIITISAVSSEWILLFNYIKFRVQLCKACKTGSKKKMAEHYAIIAYNFSCITFSCITVAHLYLYVVRSL